MLSSLPVVLVTLLSLASTTIAIPTNLDGLHSFQPRDTGRKCGSDLTPETISEKEKDFATLLAGIKTSDKLAVAEGNFTVPVNFNVIYASTNISDGYVP